MKSSPTLVLEQDDERTAIDLRFVELAPPPEPTEVAHEVDESIRSMCHKTFRRWPFAVIVVASLLIALLSVSTYRERRVANDLRRAIHAIEQDLETRVVSSSFPDGGARGRDENVAPSVADSLGEARDELERRSAALLARNSFEEALSYYRALAARFPDDTEFSHFVTVLETKLRCRTDRRSPGSTCD